MAMFGELEHHALADLVKVLAPQTGTLFFHQAYHGRTLELTLMQGHLRAMYLDGFPVHTQTQVRDILQHLHVHRRGAFEFQRRGFPTSVSGFYDLPLSNLLLDLDDDSIPSDQLPHPDTRFLTIPGTPFVPPSLASVWTLLQPFLIRGASAAEITSQLGLTQRDVLGMLHRLRAVDLIAPYRATTLTLSPPVPSTLHQGVQTSLLEAAPEPSSSAPIVQRLLGALRRLTGASRI
ncbi:hypothetical protein [Deinococcus hopiensis]|uniref:DUF4388 domain-containing protein n=1 Tax=Deinococcus hopiensis KR-140 TaxID=695939 RepID=A0A1W1UYX8_9DEIO|nr:hypothetical protein [Deinococcus hopiensis]SMB86315.1 hypothetical protein SAMN00790413_03762 [Deinococcus hopiensis KR-140]